MKSILYIYHPSLELLTKEKVQKFVPREFELFSCPYNMLKKNLNILRKVDYILLSWGKIPIDNKLLAQANRLKFIQKLGSGFDSSNLKLLKNKKIKNANTSGVNSCSVAEHTFLLILALAKNFEFFRTNLESHKTNKIFKKLLHGGNIELRGKTLGLIGFGHIGQKVAKIAKAFKMNVLYYCLNRKAKSSEKRLAVSWMPMDQILKKSDFISVHLALNQKTKYFFTKKEFKKMKKTSFFINTSRGGLVCEKDLLKVLNEEGISGAGLDVLQDETQIENSIFFHHPKVIITPHIAGVTKEVFEKMIKKGLKNIVMVNRARGLKI